ncbi:hypothetical protein [Algoriphagus sp.]|uniref:hypothetical protein n=1 Tax=Algoriphagus sp. TaxID=1872435 RepID=UPI00391DBE95
MRKIFILTLFLANHTTLLAQEFLSSLLDRTDFCNSELSEEQTAQLKDELFGLEDYFIKKGLLADKSGRSYHAVYKKIAAENNLNFNLDSTFQMLNSLDFKVLLTCYYKVLCNGQLSDLNLNHYVAGLRISEYNAEEISPRIVAQRILDNLTMDDFELDFFRVSSLVTFYLIANSTSIIDQIFDSNEETDSNFEYIKVLLDEKSRICIEKKIVSVDKAKAKINQFLSQDPNNRGIELTSSRSATYKSYLELMEEINAIYKELNEGFSPISKKIIMKVMD